MATSSVEACKGLLMALEVRKGLLVAVEVRKGLLVTVEAGKQAGTGDGGGGILFRILNREQAWLYVVEYSLLEE